MLLQANLVKKMGYGGAMIWSLSHDDHLSQCGHGNFPLIKRVQQTLGIPGRRADVFL
jgi:GH18 family chitinase